MIKKILSIARFLIHFIFSVTIFALTLFAVANPAALLGIASSSSILSPTLLSYGLLPTMLAFSSISFNSILNLLWSVLPLKIRAKPIQNVLKPLILPLLLFLLPFPTITSLALLIPAICLTLCSLYIMHRTEHNKPTIFSQPLNTLFILHFLPTIALPLFLTPALIPASGILFLCVHHINNQPIELKHYNMALYCVMGIGTAAESFIDICLIGILAPLALSTTPILAPFAPLVAAISGIICSVHPLIAVATDYCFNLFLCWINGKQSRPSANNKAFRHDNTNPEHSSCIQKDEVIAGQESKPESTPQAGTSVRLSNG